MDQVETIIIGAGVVGLAISRALSHVSSDVLIVEAGETIGQGISSRNSEVIHAGLYYPSETLKTKLCTEGNRLIYEFADTYHVPYEKIGKLVLASASQKTSLAHLYQQAKRNNVEIEWLNKTQLQERAPEVSATHALFSPNSGIIDSHQLMRALLSCAQRDGATLALDTRVETIIANNQGFEVQGISAQMPFRIQARQLVIAAGLSTQQLLMNIDRYPKQHIPPLHMAKGDYFKLQGSHPFKHLIYPLPDPKLGGLGIHLTLDLQGQARFGPDVDYTDIEHYSVDKKKAIKFARHINNYWPTLTPDRLSPDYAGIRPKLSGPNAPFQDFCVHTEKTHQLPGLITLTGIESPGLTAALALANYVCDQLTSV